MATLTATARRLRLRGPCALRLAPCACSLPLGGLGSLSLRACFKHPLPSACLSTAPRDPPAGARSAGELCAPACAGAPRGVRAPLGRGTAGGGGGAAGAWRGFAAEGAREEEGKEEKEKGKGKGAEQAQAAAREAAAGVSEYLARARAYLETFDRNKAEQLAKFVYDEVKDTFTHESDTATKAPERVMTNREATAVMASPNAAGARKGSAGIAGRWMDSAFDRVSSNPTFQRISETYEDIKENIENSDHPLAHRVRDMNDSLFGETEAARTTRTIRQWDPDFDSVKFLQRLRVDLPVIVRAYLRGDKATLEATCVPQMTERFYGQYEKWQSDGLEMDDNILDVEDVELLEMKLMGDAPTAVVRFTAQQINCVRYKKTGEVERGAPDDVHSVHYLAAMELQEGEVHDDGTYSPPRWLLREMAVHGMVQIF